MESFNEAKYKAIMDGLKCREILLSETYNATDYLRLEAEYFNSTAVSYHKAWKGSEIVKDIQYGTSKYCDEIQEGYPVLRLNELHNGFIENPQKYCHILSSAEFEKLRLKKGDVLIIRTNGNPNLVGRAAVVLEDTEFAFASYLYRIVPNEKINSETLVAYLNCKYGRYEIDKNSIKGNQTNFSPAKFCDINIPQFGADIQKGIKNLFKEAYRCRSEADSAFLSAQQVLASALDVDGFMPEKHNISIRSISESFDESGRLDSEYYQPKYDSYVNKLQTTNTVQTLCNFYDKNYIPKSDVSYRYIELADVDYFGNICNAEVILGKNLPSRARRQVKAGQVIIASVEGSLQSCALITDEYDNSLCSTGFYVLDSERINSETLLVLFKSKPMQELLKQHCSGTILTALTKDELFSIPFPEIDGSVQKKIAEKIQQSFAFRRQSEQLLKLAKHVVEYAIEQDETKAMECLKGKL